MDNRLRKLEIKKLVQEYSFLSTEDEYRKEVISDTKSVFMERVGKIREELNMPLSEPKEPNEGEVKDPDNNKPENVSFSTKNKVKKIYREIVKLTHPDKTNSDELIEIYRKATLAADNYNIL